MSRTSSRNASVTDYCRLIQRLLWTHANARNLIAVRIAVLLLKGKKFISNCTYTYKPTILFVNVRFVRIQKVTNTTNKIDNTSKN